MSISDSNKRIVSVATQSFATASTIKAYWDDNRQSSIEILSCPGSPHAGVTSFSTLGLSDHPIPNGRKQLPLRVELVGACGSQFDEFANILASAAFCIINSNWLCHPGAIFPGVVSKHRPDSPMKHLLFVPPFLWDPPLKKLKLADKTVAWLMAIPISDPEYQHAMDQGRDTLEAELEHQNIDFYNLDRPSIC